VPTQFLTLIFMRLEAACNQLGENLGMDPLTVILAVRVELERARRGGDEYEFDDWVVEEGDGEGIYKLNRVTNDLNGASLRPARLSVKRDVERVLDVVVHRAG
jgi:hypothetical protein